MKSTAYLPLQTIGNASPDSVGGICRWWYTPIQNIQTFPDVVPTTQKLIAEPTLKAGATWYGPVSVPDQERGWKQARERAKPGPWQKQQVTGLMPGLDENAHINLNNLSYHKFCVVALVRARHFFIILGNDQTGMELDDETATGASQFDSAGSKFSLNWEGEALILPSFSPLYSLPSPGSSGTTPGGGSGGGSNAPDMESIPFTNVSIILVDYNTTRRTRFGDFPNIEVWLLDSTTSKYFKSPSAEILVDAAPPNQTTFTIKPGNNSTGFIILSK